MVLSLIHISRIASFVAVAPIDDPQFLCLVCLDEPHSWTTAGGSLTQSSLLLIGPNVHPGYVRQIINLTQTTSGSYLLMSLSLIHI